MLIDPAHAPITLQCRLLSEADYRSVVISKTALHKAI
jgi:hypothetical protein